MDSIAVKTDACERCALGAFAVYGPTRLGTPNQIELRRLSIRHIGARQIVLAEGEVPDRISTLRMGWAFRQKELSGRRRQILSFVVPGDFILLESLVVAKYRLPYSVKSLTPLTLCDFAIGDMLQIVQSTEEQRDALSSSIGRYATALNRRISDLGRRNAVGRIAQLILELEGRLARRNLVQNHAFEFPLRQEHIADATGLTGAHVNRVLSEMRKNDLIDLVPRRLRILDYERLVRVAEEG